MSSDELENNQIFDGSNPAVRTRILNSAIRRANEWLSLKRDSMTSALESSAWEKSKKGAGIGEMGNLQVGGLSVHKKPMLALPPFYVLKPIQKDERGFREVAFYESITMGNVIIRGMRGGMQHTKVDDDGTFTGAEGSVVSLLKFQQDRSQEIEHLRRLSKLTASYYGVLVIGKYSYILLSDATANFQNPCVMDLKMGQRTFEPFAKPQKIKRERAKYAQQELFGFRIVGMRVHDASHPDADALGFRIFDNNFGRTLDTKSKIKNAFAMFFGYDVVLIHGHSHNVEEMEQKKLWKQNLKKIRVDYLTYQQTSLMAKKYKKSRAISNIISDLCLVRQWFEDNHFLALYSSSLLIVHEGERTNIKMIDFAHITNEKGGDGSGYLHGIEILIKLLEELLKSID